MEQAERKDQNKNNQNTEMTINTFLWIKNVLMHNQIFFHLNPILSDFSKKKNRDVKNEGQF